MFILVGAFDRTDETESNSSRMASALSKIGMISVLLLLYCNAY